MVWDADRIVNLDAEHGGLDKEKFERIVERIFKTDQGKELARLLVNTTETK